MEYVQEGHGAAILDLYGAVSKRLLLYVKTGRKCMFLAIRKLSHHISTHILLLY